MAGSVLVNTNPRSETAEQIGTQGWQELGGLPAFTRRALVKGAKVSTLKTCSCFRTFDLTTDSEPSRTLTGSQKGGELSQRSPEVTPREMGKEGTTPRSSSSTEGHSKGRRALNAGGADIIWGEQSPRQFLGHIST